MMYRYLAPLPNDVTPADVTPLTLTRWPLAMDVNEVDDSGTRSVAVYLSDEADSTDVTGWRADVAVATNTVTQTQKLIDERVAALPEALERAARLLTKDLVISDVLDDEMIASIAPLFPLWSPGIAVSIGDVYAWDGTLVEVIQAHTTQADWTPDVVPALWKIHRTPDMVEWVAGISVAVGDVLTYQGTTYRCLQAHTTQAGWEPPTVPALWVVES